jgi:hypothetical protein
VVLAESRVAVIPVQNSIAAASAGVCICVLISGLPTH